MTCPIDTAISAVDLRHLPWGTQATARTDPSKAICPTARSMNLTPSYAAMDLAESRAKKLYPHSPRKQRQYLSRLKEIYSDD